MHLFDDLPNNKSGQQAENYDFGPPQYVRECPDAFINNVSDESSQLTLNPQHASHKRAITQERKRLRHLESEHRRRKNLSEAYTVARGFLGNGRANNMPQIDVVYHLVNDIRMLKEREEQLKQFLERRHML